MPKLYTQTRTLPPVTFGDSSLFYCGVVMFYEFYTILYKVSQDSEQHQPQVPETEKEDEAEESEDEEEVAGRAAASRHPNPYAEFLAAITDSPEEEGAGLMGGLKSWLGFAGSMTGTAASVLGDSGPNKPWLRGDKVTAAVQVQ